MNRNCSLHTPRRLTPSFNVLLMRVYCLRQGLGVCLACLLCALAADVAAAATFTVTNTFNAGAGSLRQELIDAQGSPGLNTVAFDIPGSGVQTITPTNALPFIVHPVIIDGATQPGYAGLPLIEVNGAAAGLANGLEIYGGSTTIKGLVINRFALSGIVLVTNGNNQIEASFIGTDATGTIAAANTNDGITIYYSPNNVVGGTNLDDGNVISGNLLGGVTIVGNLSRSNRIQGNFIGTDVSGVLPRGNRDGILLTDSPDNIVGGDEASEANIISGNTEDGIGIGGGLATGNLIQGNVIGLNSYQTAALGNRRHGILVSSNTSTKGAASNNVLGGTSYRAANVVSGNGGDGVQLGFGATGNQVIGNFIGVDYTGTGGFGNLRHGVSIFDSTNNIIGSATKGAGNIIAGNNSNGVFIGVGGLLTGSVSNSVQGNHIGVEGAGNGAAGVFIEGSSGNVVGGFQAGQGNWIAFNGTNLLKHGHGVVVGSGTANPIVGNSIWSNAGRGIDLGNDSFDLNDIGDLDTGPNDRQNYPVPTRVAFYPQAGYHEVTWTLSSKTNRSYYLEFFANAVPDGSGFGEGERKVSELVVSTDANGVVVFTNQFSMSDSNISATATDVLENNTSEFSPVDTDGDGIPDAWETTGIDVNEDGTLDLVLNSADPLHKDIFVEIDSMAGRAPDEANLDRVIIGAGTNDGFINAPNALVQNPDGRDGVELHLELDETNLPLQSWPNDDWSRFDVLKTAHFGTAAQRADPNWPNIAAARRLVYHYCLFVDAITDASSTTGRGEVGGNDLFIALGTTASSPTSDLVPANFMHELGHNLGLLHGGADPLVYKLNYHSVMNYQWNESRPYNAKGWVLDYSREQFSLLDEAHLVEANGVGGTSNHIGHFVLAGPYQPGTIATGISVVPETGPIDWNTNGLTNEVVARDINYLPGYVSSPGESMAGSEDWSRLRYYFLDNTNWADNVHADENSSDLPRAILDQLQNIGSGVGLLQFCQPNYSVSETGGTAIITVTRISETDGSVSIAYSTADGTAVHGVRYTRVSGVLNFTGSQSAQTFSIPVLNDSIAEGPQTVLLTLANPTGGASLGQRSTAVLTITDDDLPGHYTVINTNDSGPGSLRQAIVSANAAGGLSLIDFNISAGSLTIAPGSILPAISNATILDATTQPGYQGAPLIELMGAGAGNGDGLRVLGGGCTIRGLIIDHFSGNGISLANSGGNHVEGCFIGWGGSAQTAQGNLLNGISVLSTGNSIGGTNAGMVNYICGNGTGIGLSGASNLVAGNVIGLNTSDAIQANRTVGILVSAAGNIIGGTAPGLRNVISGNGGAGIEIDAGQTVLRGNFIGTDPSGGITRPNNGNGVTVRSSGNNIGGAALGAGNVVSGNYQYGIELLSASSNSILGNWIGTDIAGQKPWPNQFGGIFLTSSSQRNQIGDVTAGAANTIAYNYRAGVSITTDFASNNVVRGNAIFANVALGIDLGPQYVTYNDTNDTDIGANQLQNFPLLFVVSNSAAGTFIAGALNSRPNANYTIDFYANQLPDPSGYGQGQFWFGSISVLTDDAGNVTFTNQIPAVNLRGQIISATATDSAGNTSEFSPTIVAVSSLPGRTFTVLNTNDSGAGSLREALLQANLYFTAGNTIDFDIPGAGVHTISPLTALPSIYLPLLLDGYSQPGASQNNGLADDNAVLLIELNGSLAGAANGLFIGGGDIIVRGLVINRFANIGVQITGLGRNHLEGNFIGTDPTGSYSQGNVNQGVFVFASSSNVIGGPLPAMRNVISGNKLFSPGPGLVNLSGDGVSLGNAASPGLVNQTSATRIEGNFIGVAADGVSPLGNDGFGVRFGSSATNTTVGGTSFGTANVIAFNGSVIFPFLGGGVSDPQGFGNAVLGNSIYSNIGLGIEGNLVNSAGGPGNFPFLGSAMTSNGTLTIAGRLNSLTNTAHRIEFFVNDTFDPSGFGQGHSFLGSTNVTTDGNGFVAFTAVLSAAATNGQFITATATDAQNNTSEFSPRLRVGDVLTNVIVVNTADDLDYGAGNASHTSLREAMFAANNHPGPDTILFSIGQGTQTIYPSNALPAVMDTLTLDGTSQPGFGGQPLIALDGRSGITTGLRLYAPSNSIRGLCLNRFTYGIYASGGYAPSAGGNIIEGNYLGTDITGTGAGGYQDYGIRIESRCSSNRIGGTVASARNLISGNNKAGLYLLNCDGNIVQGNFVGTDVSGTNRLTNGRGIDYIGGIIVIQCDGTLIGGAAPGARNIISANFTRDLYTQDSTRSLIEGNFIGTDVTGSSSLNYADVGIDMSGTVGLNVIENNLISAPYSPALLLASSSNVITGNLVGTDATGTRSIGNQQVGMNISGTGNVVGGTFPGAANIISGGFIGIQIGCCDNTFQGNLIGTAVDRTTPMGNRSDGVQIQGNGNLVGGVDPATANIIAFNQGKGIAVSYGTSNALLGNSIFGNSGLGIDLGANGVTPNDDGDTDSGPNNLQNFPILSMVKNAGTFTHIDGVLNAQRNTVFRLEFFENMACDPSGYGQGQHFVGATTVSTDNTGTVPFSVDLPVALGVGKAIAAAATDSNNNTSEFSPCVTVTYDTNVIALSVNNSSNGYVLSWPTQPGSYLLQSTTNLVSPITWQIISNGISTNGLAIAFQLKTNLADPVRFFRLTKPQ